MVSTTLNFEASYCSVPLLAWVVSRKAGMVAPGLSKRATYGVGGRGYGRGAGGRG